MFRKSVALLLALVVALCALPLAMAEETPADDEIVARVYTLENAM